MVSRLDRLIESYHSPECEFNIDKSIEVCNEILSIDPTLIEYQSELASSYYKKEEYEKTIELFIDYKDKGGDADLSNFMIALSYAKLNEREKAFEYLEMIEGEENSYLYLLRFHYRLMEYDKAIEYGDQLLEMNPENRFALDIMSKIYGEIDDDERSIFYFNELANLNPELKIVELFRLYSLERYSDVIEIFEGEKGEGTFDEALENDQFNYIIGRSYFELRKAYDALKYLIESDRLKGDIDKKATIARTYMNIYQFKNAHRYLSDALRIDPLDEECLFMMSENCYYREEYIRSIEYANILLNNHSNNRIFHVLAAVYLELGEIEKAFENRMLGTTLMINADEYEGEYLLIIALRLSEAGLYKRAMKIYDALLRKYPEYDYVYLERAKLHKRMGNEGLAKKDFKRYNDIMLNRNRKYEEIFYGYDY